MNQTESIKTLLESMAKAQAEFTTLPKNTDGYGYKYTDLDTVISYIRPIMAKHNLAFMQTLTALEGHTPAITTRIFHTTGEWLEDTTPLPSVQVAKGNAAQNLGAAITYMKRYTLCAMLGISSDEDVDGKTAPGDTRGNNHDVPAQKKKFEPVNNNVLQPAGGPDTPEQGKRIREILRINYPDGTEMFSQQEKKALDTRRLKETADEVIAWLEAEEEKRTNAYWDEQKAKHQEAQEKTAPVTTAEEKGAKKAFDIF